MEKSWKFVTDTHADEFRREIAAELVRRFGISEDEAIGRINQQWGHLGEFLSIAYHETTEYWAHHLDFGHDSYWWIRDESTRTRLGLGPIEPLPYP